MNAYGTSAEEFHSLAIALLRAQQTRQWLLDIDQARERRLRTPQNCATRCRYRVAGIAVLAILLCSSMCLGQSTFGSIRGTVQDLSGAAIPDAQVTLHSVDESSDRKVTTDATGGYTLENVKAGKDSLQGQRAGFADTVIDGITLAARQDLRFTLSMAVSAQQTTVEVTSSAAEINTENATVGDSKNTMEIGQLPLNFRASTTSPLAALATSANVQQDSQGNFTSGGATSNMVGFSVDGISTTNVFNSAAGANPYPSPEGIAELKVTAFNNNAEFSQVGDVTFTTRGGTNNFHGSLFEYLQNDALDARVFNFAKKAPKRFNTFGGSLGGPLSIPHIYNGRDKTFFFFDYEGNRRRTAQAQQYTVPSLQDRMGNLSDLKDANGNALVLRNPFTGGTYQNSTITNINSFATALLNKYYPLPNASLAGGANYQTLVPIPSNTDGIDARIDHVISSKQQMYARFNRKNLLVNVVNPLLPNDVDTEPDRSFRIF